VLRDAQDAVRDAERHQRMTDDAMERDRLIDRQRTTEQRSSRPGEQPAHHGQEQERAVEVDAESQRTPCLHQLVRGYPLVGASACGRPRGTRPS
jgi:hypothetical protein